MGVDDKLEDAEKASNFVMALLDAMVSHPWAFLCVVLAIAFVICCLPNGVVKQIIVHRTEMRKLDERVGQSRKKLTSNRQNRRN
ncbi:hypothetical protein [Novosphingobium sp. RL4]|uniref:hypothetical protein n=1 Tax=Novosphingobium sp. RL4 TaxID=3109595 RepID=UPI002D767B13|nr:hypothetical protein [Novosphingobium sp. RL4]WRT91374.1 hypothetical protein U9J33_09030 [Novosphingobium sp. RL4]